MDFVDIVDTLRARGFDDAEINQEINRAVAESEHDFADWYESDPFVQDGWHQQDIIDMYRRER